MLRNNVSQSGVNWQPQISAPTGPLMNCCRRPRCGPVGRTDPAAVVGAARLRAVGDDPQVAGAIEADVVRRADRAQLVGVRVAGVVGAVLPALRVRSVTRRPPAGSPPSRNTSQRELARRVIVAGFANLDDVTERIRAARIRGVRARRRSRDRRTSMRRRPRCASRCACTRCRCGRSTGFASTSSGRSIGVAPSRLRRRARLDQHLGLIAKAGGRIQRTLRIEHERQPLAPAARIEARDVQRAAIEQIAIRRADSSRSKRPSETNL